MNFLTHLDGASLRPISPVCPVCIPFAGCAGLPNSYPQQILFVFWMCAYIGLPQCLLLPYSQLYLFPRILMQPISCLSCLLFICSLHFHTSFASGEVSAAWLICSGESRPACCSHHTVSPFVSPASWACFRPPLLVAPAHWLQGNIQGQIQFINFSSKCWHIPKCVHAPSKTSQPTSTGRKRKIP